MFSEVLSVIGGKRKDVNTIGSLELTCHFILAVDLVEDLVTDKLNQRKRVACVSA
jgi:BarA-like signal transduction histidine kinase